MIKILVIKTWNWKTTKMTLLSIIIWGRTFEWISVGCTLSSVQFVCLFFLFFEHFYLHTGPVTLCPQHRQTKGTDTLLSTDQLQTIQQVRIVASPAVCFKHFISFHYANASAQCVLEIDENWIHRRQRQKNSNNLFVRKLQTCSYSPSIKHKKTSGLWNKLFQWASHSEWWAYTDKDFLPKFKQFWLFH